MNAAYYYYILLYNLMKSRNLELIILFDQLHSFIQPCFLSSLGSMQREHRISFDLGGIELTTTQLTVQLAGVRYRNVSVY